MLTTEIAIPIWAFLLLLTISVVGLVDRAFIPGLRWFLRRRINRAINEVNTRLRMSLRPFHLTKRQVLLDRLMFDPEVLAAMQAHARAEGMPHEVAQAKVAEYAREIVPAFNAFVYFRFGYWLSKRIARLLFRVRVGFEQDQRLGDVAPDSTVVFVMNHRSNMDYVLVSYLVSEESTLSYAVGEWARVWPLDTLLKAMGAFFVRRNSGNAMYRKVLERYVRMATEQGVCQAVFLEGGLSHDGKLRAPRLGFLDYMLRGYDPEKDRDIVFVPIGINYDRVVEDRSLLRRKDPGAPKRSRWFMFRTSFGFYRKQMALSPKERRKRFGFAGVNFGVPISLRTYCAERSLRFAETGRDERFQQVEALAYDLMSAIARVVPILPVPLVARVLDAAGDAGLGPFEVKARAYALIDAMQRDGAPIRDAERPKERTLQGALDLLAARRIIRLDDAGHYVTAQGAGEILAFYANSLSHWT